ncbi:MAG: hypothetical protein AAF846_07185, partial [Chloroflexota bacterium]
RYRHDWKLRFGYSFIYSLALGASFLGFVQLNYWHPRMDYVPIVFGGLIFGAGAIARATFKSSGWIAFIIQSVALFIVIRMASHVGLASEANGILPVFLFESEAQSLWLSILMATVISFGIFAWSILEDLLGVFSLKLQDDGVLPDIVQQQPDY